MTSQVDRANNAVAYISPSFSGFNAVLAYSSNIGNSNNLGPRCSRRCGNSCRLPSVNGNAGDATLYTANLNYNNGPLSLSADYEYINFYGGEVSSAYCCCQGP
jgi:predicted porin